MARIHGNTGIYSPPLPLPPRSLESLRYPGICMQRDIDDGRVVFFGSIHRISLSSRPCPLPNRRLAALLRGYAAERVGLYVTSRSCFTSGVRLSRLRLCLAAPHDYNCPCLCMWRAVVGPSRSFARASETNPEGFIAVTLGSVATSQTSALLRQFASADNYSFRQRRLLLMHLPSAIRHLDTLPRGGGACLSDNLACFDY
ncbi:hypothetical protein GQ53DRAFT_159397 [Thozetella sp. PMI_491]|nr:hypothetical protein GQ53DRAFT_159397 [Thozetella sp. PMI_491]